jgi:uncharacterized protein (DUF1501 family)
MECSYACRSADHLVSRRRFLGGITGGALIGGMGGFAGLIHPAAARELHDIQKRVLVIWLSGGVSQLETWDPKPGTDTGGPFRSIPTTVPGIYISELLPQTALQMHRMAIIRGVNTAEDDHGKGYYIMHTGRRQEPSTDYPSLGAVAAKMLAPAESPLPGHIHISPGGGGFGKQDSAFLGPRYASVTLGDGKPPADIARAEGLSEEADRRRNAMRAQVNSHFTERRRTAETEAFNYSFDRAAQLMERRDVFDLSREDPRNLERYGRHDFGRHCMLAKRLLENGITFVKVTHTNYDTHFENFDYHIEQLGEFDRPFATLLEDLAQSGLLETTLVVVMSEFGRTPKINAGYGRDHWSKAWSVALAGCGIQHGALIGKTNNNGTAVTDREVNGGHLFHTYFRALGLDPAKKYYINERPIPVTDPKASAIDELLA